MLLPQLPEGWVVATWRVDRAALVGAVGRDVLA
jgi:hypothetical protein